jgi:hypothetical protein
MLSAQRALLLLLLVFVFLLVQALPTGLSPFGELHRTAYPLVHVPHPHAHPYALREGKGNAITPRLLPVVGRSVSDICTPFPTIQLLLKRQLTAPPQTIGANPEVGVHSRRGLRHARQKVPSMAGAGMDVKSEKIIESEHSRAWTQRICAAGVPAHAAGASACRSALCTCMLMHTRREIWRILRPRN